jgi:hypothetical protein
MNVLVCGDQNLNPADSAISINTPFASGAGVLWLKRMSIPALFPHCANRQGTVKASSGELQHAGNLLVR